jgi:hypothetical protein
MFAELSKEHSILKDFISKKGCILQTKGTDGADR